MSGLIRTELNRVVLLLLAVGGCASDPLAPERGGLEPAGIVYTQDFEAGPVDSINTPGLAVFGNPNVLVEWQTSHARSGTAAYHMRGGNLTNGDASIHNRHEQLPFGGLEVWVGGAFYFVSFPNTGISRPVWLIATVPTDGVSGADDKPIAAVNSEGKLVLTSSNPASRTKAGTVYRQSILDVPLETGRWYYIVLHGRNGIAKTHQLYLYDDAGALLGVAGLVFDVQGTFVYPISKWGFGTSQNSSGLEYYLDDIYHAQGTKNPRVP